MPGNIEWTDPEKKKLKALAKAGADPDECERSLPGRSWNAARHKMHDLGFHAAWCEKRKPAKNVTPHKRPDFCERPETPLDLDEWLDRAVRVSDERPKAVDYRKIIIETDVPIAVMKASDLHFGGLDVDYRALRAHVRFLLETPQMYLQLFGDDINLMIGHRVTAVRRDFLTPEEQFEFLHAFVWKLLDEGKLLSMASAGHGDEFTERSAGFGIVKLIVEKAVPYFRGLGYIDLVLRTSTGTETTYPMAFVHKTRFNSFMNAVHGAKRMLQLHNEFFGADRPIAREYITAHTHNPALTTEGMTPDDRIILIKTGTFKTDCLYSQRYFGQGRIGVPTVVYHPDRFEHVGFPTPHEAYRYMTGEDWQ